MNAKHNHMKMMADKGKEKKIDSDSKVYCNEKQWGKKKKTFGIVEGDFVSAHTFISTQFCTCKRKKKSRTHSCTRSASPGGFTFSWHADRINTVIQASK